MKISISSISVVLTSLLFWSICQAGDINLEEITVLDLETAQKIALADNPSLAAAAERVEQARQRVKQAKAMYYPTLALNGSTGTTVLSETYSTTQSTLYGYEVDSDKDNYQLSLVANWLIFDGFSRKFTNLLAKYSGEETEQAHRDGQRILLQSVAESYYNAHLALYSITIAQANMDFNQQQLDEAQIRYEHGSSALSNVLNFKVQINKAKTTLLTARRDYEIGRYGLAVLLGRDDAILPKHIKLAELNMLEKENFYAAQVDTLVTTAIELRPDLQQSELRVKQSEAAIGNAEAPLYPTFGLQGSLNGDRSEDAYLEGDDFGSTIALSLSYNLYRGGSDKAKFVESKAAKREASRSFEQQKNLLHGEVRQSYANLKLAQEQLVLQRSTTELVTQTRDLVQEGYNAGQESLVRLNEAQRDLVETQSNLALSLVGLYRFRYNLKTVTGESLTPFYTAITEQK